MSGDSRKRALNAASGPSCRRRYCKVHGIGFKCLEAQRESSVHLEGHRLVHDRLVGRIPRGEVRPLRYFGEDLVAYRDESGELHVLTRHTAGTWAPISDTAARSSATASSARSTAGAGVRTAPTATSPTSRPAQQGAAAAGLPGQRAIRLRVHVAPSARRAAAVGDARHLRLFPQFESDPTATTGRTPNSPAGPSASRCTRRSSPKRPGQRAFPVRAPRHRHAADAWTGKPSTRNASSPAGPTRAATTRTRWR